MSLLEFSEMLELARWRLTVCIVQIVQGQYGKPNRGLLTRFPYGKLLRVEFECNGAVEVRQNERPLCEFATRLGCDPARVFTLKGFQSQPERLLVIILLGKLRSG